jgi:hypothetical protein
MSPPTARDAAEEDDEEYEPFEYERFVRDELTADGRVRGDPPVGALLGILIVVVFVVIVWALR